MPRRDWSVRRTAAFVVIGIVLYGLVLAASQWLLYRTGDSNPLFKIATRQQARYDWVILGASHAMPLDFGDFNAYMQADSSRSILNLAATGAGPLVNHFVLERFFKDHEADNILIVVDSFAYRAPDWNEDRFGDRQFISRMPLQVSTALLLFRYVGDGVAWRVLLDYVTGFSTINNRERFQPDLWEGEAKFDRAFRPSSAADRQRIAYLYQAGAGLDQAERYLDVLADTIMMARAHGTAVTVVKPPLPERFRVLLPKETEFDELLRKRLSELRVTFEDFATVLPEPRDYFDTDHLNRAGVQSFYHKHLKPLFVADGK